MSGAAIGLAFAAASTALFRFCVKSGLIQGGAQKVDAKQPEQQQEQQKQQQQQQHLLPSTVRSILSHRPEDIDPRMPEYIRLLSDLGAHECWHKHGTFAEHLVDVWSILVLWGQPEAVCRMGLFHSTYSNSFVNLALLKPDADRGVLRRLVGDEAEFLVDLFCSVPRMEILFKHCIPAGRVPESITVKHIRTGAPLVLDKKTIATFLLFTMADWSEQWFGWQDHMFGNHEGKFQFQDDNPHTLWPGDNRPGMWMSFVSRLGAMVREAADCGVAVPPVFAACTHELSGHDERRARDLYWDVVHNKTEARDAAAALAALQEAVACNPFVAEPRVVMAQLLLAAGRFDEAAAQARRAVELLSEWGTAWDKRVMWRGWVAWARVLLQSARERTWPDTAMGVINLGLVDGIDRGDTKAKAA
jgi:hypothetical protein